MRIEWHERAACAGLPWQLFHPERGGNCQDVYAEARQICHGCPVRWECLDQALRCEQQRMRVGMWGGLSPDQRDRYAAFRRKMRKQLA